MADSIGCPICSATVSARPREIHGEYKLYDCPGCEVVFCDPLKPAPADWYGEKEYYAVRWEFGEFVRERPRAGGRLLEIGCGEGIFLEGCRRAGYEVVGLDFNPDAVTVTRSKGLAVHETTLEEYLRGGAKPFDVVAFFHTLEHVENPRAFLRCAWSALAEGGYLAISVPNEKRWNLLVEPREWWDFPPHHMFRFTPQALRMLLEGSGFEVKRMADEPINGLQRVHAWLVDRAVERTSLGMSEKLSGPVSEAASAPTVPGVATTQADQGGEGKSSLTGALVRIKHALLHAVVSPVSVVTYLSYRGRLRGRSGSSLYVLAQKKGAAKAA